MEKYCIVSFGNSRKYRISIPKGDAKRDLASLKDEVKEYLKGKFPQIEALSFYDKLTVAPVPENSDEDYSRFPELNKQSLAEIESVLSTEVEDAESLEELNSNAPWNSIH